MRTLIISDIHGNRAALEAVTAEPHDDVICLGDIVGYGPEPLACLSWVRANAGIVVAGNHDCAAFDGSSPQCRPAFERFAAAVAVATATQLSRADRDYLGALPRRSFFARGERTYLCVHATPHDPLYRYLAYDRAGWVQELAGVEADILFVGHTHLPFVLDARERRVVNPGSVGQPKDGDPRAAYAVLEDGNVTLKRAAYAIDHTTDGLGRLRLAQDIEAPLVQLLRTGDPAAVNCQDARTPSSPVRSPAVDRSGRARP